MYEARIETVMQNLARRGLSQMLVCDPRSIQYLTGAYVEPGERFLGLVLGEGRRPTSRAPCARSTTRRTP